MYYLIVRLKNNNSSKHSSYLKDNLVDCFHEFEESLVHIQMWISEDAPSLMWRYPIGIFLLGELGKLNLHLLSYRLEKLFKLILEPLRNGFYPKYSINRFVLALALSHAKKKIIQIGYEETVTSYLEKVYSESYCKDYIHEVMSKEPRTKGFYLLLVLMQRIGDPVLYDWANHIIESISHVDYESSELAGFLVESEGYRKIGISDGLAGIGLALLQMKEIGNCFLKD
jgi:hypothetical protein